MKITVDRALLEQAIDNCLFDAIGYSLAGMQIPFGDIDTVATEVKKSFTENVASYKALRDALAAPPQVPLTEEEIDDIWDCTFNQDDPSRTRSFRQIITRALERAHGIGETK